MRGHCRSSGCGKGQHNDKKQEQPFLARVYAPDRLLARDRRRLTERIEILHHSSPHGWLSSGTNTVTNLRVVRVIRWSHTDLRGTEIMPVAIVGRGVDSSGSPASIVQYVTL